MIDSSGLCVMIGSLVHPIITVLQVDFDLKDTCFMGLFVEGNDRIEGVLDKFFVTKVHLQS